jgi:hypothetical protein
MSVVVSHQQLRTTAISDGDVKQKHTHSLYVCLLLKKKLARFCLTTSKRKQPKKFKSGLAAAPALIGSSEADSFAIHIQYTYYPV